MKEYSANLASSRQAVTYPPCFQVRHLLAKIGCRNWKVHLCHNLGGDGGGFRKLPKI